MSHHTDTFSSDLSLKQQSDKQSFIGRFLTQLGLHLKGETRERAINCNQRVENVLERT